MKKNWLDFKDEMECWWDESLGKPRAIQDQNASFRRELSPPSFSPTTLVQRETEDIDQEEVTDGVEALIDDNMSTRLGLDDYQNNTAAGRDSVIRGFVSLFGKETINVSSFSLLLLRVRIFRSKSVIFPRLPTTAIVPEKGTLAC